MFKKIGDCCGGFNGVDEDTRWLYQLQLARILVKTEGKDLPKTLHLVVGSSCFSIRLWWEVLLWVSVVVPMRSFCISELEKVRDGVEAGSCAERSVGETLYGVKDGVECADREEKGRWDVVFDRPAKMVENFDGGAGIGVGKGVVEEMGVVEKSTEGLERREGFGSGGKLSQAQKGKGLLIENQGPSLILRGGLGRVVREEEPRRPHAIWEKGQSSSRGEKQTGPCLLCPCLLCLGESFKKARAFGRDSISEE